MKGCTSEVQIRRCGKLVRSKAHHGQGIGGEGAGGGGADGCRWEAGGRRLVHGNTVVVAG